MTHSSFRQRFKYNTLLKVGFLLELYTVVIFLLAWKWGFHKGAVHNFKGLLEKPNWLAFPIYWPIILFLLSYTWVGFNISWRSLTNTGVMHTYEGLNPSEAAIDSVLLDFSKWRVWLFYLAFIFSIICNFIDIHEWIFCYFGNLTDCVSNYPDFSTAWFVIDKNSEELKFRNLLLVCLSYSLQVILVFLAFLAFLQTIFHVVAFWLFERFKSARHHKLELTLNSRSPFHEFGLEQWNYTLNNLYWIFTIALLIPLNSRLSQPKNELLDSGQILLQTLSPIFIAFPMIFSIIVRQFRLPKVWERLKSGSEKEVDLFHKQKIWPIDKNWSSKLGLIISFVLLSYLLGVAPYEKLLRLLG